MTNIVVRPARPAQAVSSAITKGQSVPSRRGLVEAGYCGRRSGLLNGAHHFLDTPNEVAHELGLQKVDDLLRAELDVA